jgi:hypothetical protein
MITPALREWGLSTLHLRGDGSVESTQAMEERLVKATKKDGEYCGLFQATEPQAERHAVLAEAYREMASRKAFRLKE